MALFGGKTKEEKAVVEQTSTVVSTVSSSHTIENVLVQPRVTEKASFRSEGNVYTFEIAPRASKKDVEKAVQAIYKVSPVKVNIAKIPAKKKFSRGKWGVKKGAKKAYVFLKKGDSIELN